MNIKQIFGRIRVKPLFMTAFFLSFAVFAYPIRPKKMAVELIIFSFDRPLQLYGLLESVCTYVTGISRTSVIYRTSSPAFSRAYDEVMHAFSHVRFVPQGNRPRSDFEPLLMQCLKQSTAAYVIFAVDDMVVTDFIDLSTCVHALERDHGFGFYLRLGKNIQKNFQQLPLHLPRRYSATDDVFKWRFSEAEGTGVLGYWRYPLTVDMTLYRKHDVISHLKKLRFSSPNTLEMVWRQKCLSQVFNRFGLCFNHSKVVNIPLNLVQKDFHNRHMNAYCVDDLLNKFNDGFKLDIAVLYKLNNSSAHESYEIAFTRRT